MCTVQLCIRAVKNGESQPRPALIFKGQFLKKELAMYDKRVDVYAQTKAWADRVQLFSFFQHITKALDLYHILYS